MPNDRNATIFKQCKKKEIENQIRLILLLYPRIEIEITGLFLIRQYRGLKVFVRLT